MWKTIKITNDDQRVHSNIFLSSYVIKKEKPTSTSKHPLVKLSINPKAYKVTPIMYIKTTQNTMSLSFM